jgi:hypothetical protein
MDNPVLFPHLRWDIRKAIRLAQGVAKLGTKEFRECLDREQEILASGPPRLSVFG